MPEPVSIRAQELSRRFGDFVAVDRVSFEVHPGEIFGYLGANGAGKSTTIRMLCGLLVPSDGRAWVAGVDVAADPERVKHSIGYMSQKFSLYMDLQVGENLEFFGGAFGLRRAAVRKRSAELLERIGLSEHRHDLTGSLPGGWRQRLALACAMLHGPRILFLDEPTAGVDPDSRRDFWRLIRELASSGTTVFVTTHYMDEAEYCERVGLMVDGRLAALDTPGQLKQDFVPGRIYQVGRAERARVLALDRLAGVVDVEPFGAGFHVRVSQDGPDARAITAHLRGAGQAEVSVEAVATSLEDVFLKLAGPSIAGEAGA
ncbi:MAG: ABC transporter ATP-binding protein [Deltaproteobacteria bacterium]|nr:ABC transporter ATP-binding protein [Deltaproteobacteria bacterium]